MSKKLIAIAVGAALGMSPLAASAAKVKVYGHAQFEIANVDDGTNTDTVVTDNQRGRFGIKAAEKLKNGMKAFTVFEFDIGNGSSKITGLKGNTAGQVGVNTRIAAVGLKGSFGKVEIGTLKSPYKYVGGVKYDPFTASSLEARGNGGMSKKELGDVSFGQNSFISNAVAYMSPSMNGFRIWALYSPDDSGEAKGASGDYAVAVKYNNGPMELFAKFVNNDDNAGGDGWSVGGKYKMGNHTFLGQYEKLEGNSANTQLGNNESAKVWFLGYHLRSGNNTFVAQFGATDYSSASKADIDYYTLAIIHHLSKKTRIFGGYRSTDKSGATADTDVVSIGLRMIF